MGWPLAHTQRKIVLTDSVEEWRRGYLCLDEGDGGLQVGQGCSNPPKVAFAHLTLWSLGKTTTVFCMSFRDFFIEADLKENEPLVCAPPQRSVVHEIIFGAADQGKHWEQRDCIFFCGAKKKNKKNGAAAGYFLNLSFDFRI